MSSDLWRKDESSQKVFLGSFLLPVGLSLRRGFDQLIPGHWPSRMQDMEAENRIKSLKSLSHSQTDGVQVWMILLVVYSCSVVIKLLDLDSQGRWFDPCCGHDKICTAVGALSRAHNPTLLQGVCLLLSLINCKSLWIKTSAECYVMCMWVFWEVDTESYGSSTSYLDDKVLGYSS